MEEIVKGIADVTILVFIPDPASTSGQGKTGLTHADLTVSYTRVEDDNDVVCTDVTSSLSTLSALTDAHTDWGLKEVNATKAPGLYRLDIADAVFATGARYAEVSVALTTGLAAATPKAWRLVTNDSDVLGGKLDTIDGYLDTEIAAILAVTMRLDSMLESDSPNWRLTTDALANAPGGSGSAAAVTWVVGEDLDGFVFRMRQSAAPALGAPGLTVTAERYNGMMATWEPCENSPVEIVLPSPPDGDYTIDLTAADSVASGTRVTALRFSAPGAITQVVTLILQEA